MLVPDQIIHDRYQLQRQLGQNAVRQTWLAMDLTLAPPQPVVVKLLALGVNGQWEDLKLFEREAQVLRQLNHPRIPQYRDYFAIDDRVLWFGLVEHYIAAPSLKDLLEKGQKFSETTVTHIAIELLQILIYLHGLNPPILHRDIKPSNILYAPATYAPATTDQGGEVYLVDFGAVQDKNSVEGKTFTVTGTYGYTPMEQFGGRTVPASDLYALGATLIHLLTGISPANLPQDDHMRIVFADRTSINPRLIGWLNHLVEPSVKRRLSTAQQALQELTAVSTRAIAVSTPSLSTPATSGAIVKPANSRVSLTRTAKSLNIELPPVAAPVNKAQDDQAAMPEEVINLIGWTWFGMVPIMGLWLWGLQLRNWLITIPTFLLMMGGFIFVSYFSIRSAPYWVTTVVMDDRCFTINTYRRITTRFDTVSRLERWRQGTTANIISCVAEDLETYNPSLRMMKRIPSVAIVEQINQGAKLEKYTFGAGVLSQAEAQWLASEINLWLKGKLNTP